MRCRKFKRVRKKGGGTVRRCASFGKGKARKRPASRSRKRGKRPFNKGKKCVAMGVNRAGRLTCRSYGSRSGWRARGGTRRQDGTRVPTRGLFSSLSGYGTRPAQSTRRRGFIGR